MTTDAPGVFISYRRKESSSFAGRLYDRLVQRLGEARVFMDVDSIKPGQDWTEAISHAVAQCGLMLVLIGHEWAQVRTGSSARISDTDDYVRLEIEAAFDQDIPIIPVLLEDATMPGQADLPETLVKLSHLQAMRVRHESFRSDSTTLFTVVQEVLAAHEKEGPGGGHVVVDNILASHEKDEAANRTSRDRHAQPDGAIGGRRRVRERADAPPEARSRPGPGLARRVLVPLLLLISILAVGFAIWTVIPTTTPDQASGEEIPESVDTAENPFLEGLEPDVPQTRKPKAAGAVKGDTPGLYGGTQRKTSCDAARLVAFLETHPDKGAAWAGVLGMSLDQVRAFVTQLTPVILRADTRVTNHGFVGGHATTFYSILQAGTAVLVDKHGVPAVRCFCGNPLTQARSDPPHPYRGNPWPGFDAEKVIVIKPATSAIKSFTVVDTSTEKKSSKPAGVKILPAEKSVQEPVSAETTTPPPAGPSPVDTSSAADTTSPTSSVTAGAVDTASPAESDGSTTPGSTIGTESVDPTESVTTDHPTDGSSPDVAESKGTGQETDSGKEGGKSQENSGSGGSGKTQTGTDNKQTGTDNQQTGADNKGDTGTTGGGGTNEDAGGGATSGPGTE
jgi:TIR domain